MACGALPMATTACKLRSILARSKQLQRQRATPMQVIREAQDETTEESSEVAASVSSSQLQRQQILALDDACRKDGELAAQPASAALDYPDDATLESGSSALFGNIPLPAFVHPQDKSPTGPVEIQQPSDIPQPPPYPASLAVSDVELLALEEIRLLRVRNQQLEKESAAVKTELSKALASAESKVRLFFT